MVIFVKTIQKSKKHKSNNIKILNCSKGFINDIIKLLINRIKNLNIYINHFIQKNLKNRLLTYININLNAFRKVELIKYKKVSELLF
jgi:hypothetical protein